VDNTIYLKVQDFFITFRGILFEATPWVVIGAIFAGLVQELPARRAPAIMLALGVGIIFLTVSPLPLAYNAPLAVAAGLVVCGLMLLAQPLVDRAVGFLGRERGIAILGSGFLGLVNPMCDCGVIVVMRRLLRKGMPLSCCIAYILAGPIINVLVIATTWQAFTGMQNLKGPSGQPLYLMGSGWMMASRITLGYLIAVVTAFVVEWQFRRYGPKLLAPTLQVPSGLPIIETDEYEHDEAPRQPVWKRLSNVSETALHDFVDVMVLLIPGALVAAAVRQLLSPAMVEQFSKEHPIMAIGAMSLLAFIITLCSETDAFVARTFAVRPAAQLSFLVFGPMLDLKLFFMYTRVFRPRLMWTIIVCVAVQVLVYCFIVHVLWETYAPQFWPPTPTGVPIPTAPG
jgi:uncharacterized membrane protein YraQ (UPF0718 family)